MTITTSLHPGLTTSKPGTPVPLALRLHNPDQVVQVVTLRPIGGLAEFTVVEPSSVELQPHASIEVPAVISVPPSFAPGLHSSEIAVSVDNVDVASAGATVDVTTEAVYAARIAPLTSKSASKGRHRVTIENQGNVPLDVSLTATTEDPTIEIDPFVTQLAVMAGELAFVDLDGRAVAERSGTARRSITSSS